MNTMYQMLIVFLLVVVGVVGDFFIKLSGRGPQYIEIRWFLLGCVTYAASAGGWFYIMKHVKLSILGVTSSLLTVVLLALVGSLYFHEQLNSYEIAGFAVAVVAIFLLSRSA